MKKKVLSIILVLSLLTTLLFSVEGLTAQALKAEIRTKTLAAGWNHSLVVRKDNSLWASGDNEYGQLGNGTTTSSATPVKVMTGVKSVAACGGSSLAVKTDNTLWAWGSNEYGQLGNNSYRDSVTPVKILSNVLYAEIFDYSSFAIKEDGTLWGWGFNEEYQLGDGTRTTRLKPVKIMDDVVAVHSSGWCTVAVKNDGTLWGWGYTESLFDSISDDYGYTKKPAKIMTGVAQIFLGSEHVIYLKTDGTVWAKGENDFGQLGDKTNNYRYTAKKVMTGVSAITGSEYTSYAIKTDGTLYGWGDNYSGQLGDGTTTNSNSPVVIMSKVSGIAASGGFALAVKTDGTLWGWGDNYYGQLGNGKLGYETKPVRIPYENLNPETITFVSAGYGHSMAIRQDGSLWAWGENTYGQLGDGTEKDKATPVKVMDNVAYVSAGAMHTVAVKTDGSLWAWGLYNYDFWEMEESEEITGQLTPVKLMNSGVKSVSAGYMHTLIVMENGELYAFGTNEYGELGNSSLPEFQKTPVKVSGMANVAAASAGFGFSLILKEDGQLLSVGCNYSGELGDGTTKSKTTPVAIGGDLRFASISSSNEYSLAVTTDGKLYGWGTNYEGVLGRREYALSPVQLATEVASASAAYANALLVKTNGELWGWGSNEWGFVGDGSTADRYSPVKLMNEGEVKMASMKGEHALVLKNDNTLWAWGGNYSGQLGNGKFGYEATPLKLSATGKLPQAVAQPKVSSISLTSKPTKTTYTVGDKLNMNGAKITVKYSTGMKVVIPVTAAMVSGFKTKQTGNQTLTIKYKGQKTTVKISVQSYVTLRVNYTLAIVNGKKITIDNVGTKPMKIGGRAMLPIRFVGTSLGAKVTYKSDKDPIKVTYGKTTVEFKLGSKSMKVITGSKSKVVSLDVPAQKVKGKTYVPLRAVSAALGFDVYYQSGTELIVVSNPKTSTAIRDKRLVEGIKNIK